MKGREDLFADGIAKQEGSVGAVRVLNGASGRFWLVVLLGLIALTVILYFPSLDDFFFADDYEEIVRAMVPSGQWLSRTVDLRSLDGYWFRPARRLLFLASYHLFDLKPAGYHALNLGLHAINGLLVGVLLALLTGRRRVGLLASVLFVANPTYSESVLWISGVNELAAGALSLSCIGLWAWYLRRGGRARYVGAEVAFLGALLMKETVVLLPAILVIWEWMVERRKPYSRDFWMKYVPLGTIWIVYLAAELWVQSRSDLVQSGDYVPGWHILTNLAGYLTVVAFPVWPFTESRLDTWVGWVILGPVLAILAWYLIRGEHIRRFLALWVLFSFLPFVLFSGAMSGIWPRYAYLGGMAFAGLTSCIIHDWGLKFLGKDALGSWALVPGVLLCWYGLQLRPNLGIVGERASIFEKNYVRLGEVVATPRPGDVSYFVNPPAEFEDWILRSMIRMRYREPALDGEVVAANLRAGSIERDEHTHLFYFQGERLGHRDHLFEGWWMVSGPDHLLMVEFDGLVRLVGYDAPDEAVAGAPIEFGLYWQRLGEMEGKHSAFCHLADEERKVWGNSDGEPRIDMDPGGAWGAGQMILDRRAIEVPANAPEGTYWIEVGIYEQETTTRLKMESWGEGELSDRVTVGPIRLISTVSDQDG
jgi:hypothetical protein